MGDSDAASLTFGDLSVAHLARINFERGIVRFVGDRNSRVIASNIGKSALRLISLEMVELMRRIYREHDLSWFSRKGT